MSTTTFPTTKDTFTNPTANSKRNSPSLAAGQTLQNDALAAIETSIGITGSIDTTSISYKLSGITGTDTAASASAAALGWVAVTDTWTYLSYDSTDNIDTGVVTVPSDATTKYSVGMRGKLTQSSVVNYFIITGVTSTTITMYFGTDYSLSNNPISAISFSSAKTPFGFPASPLKWTVSVTDTQDRTQSSPVNGTWYNPGGVAIRVPIGVWTLSYSVQANYSKSSTTCDQVITLSTANNSESDSSFTVNSRNAIGGATSLDIQWEATAKKDVALTSQTIYYLNTKSGNTATSILYLGSTVRPTLLKAVSAYL